MKIADIDKENIFQYLSLYHLNDLRNFNKIFRKKVPKKQGVTLSLQNTVLKKPQEVIKLGQLL